MWRRAVGPDLLLYLIAAHMSSRIPTLGEPVAQFSFHQGSITISSSPWLLRTGYWLARLWLIEFGLSEHSASSSRFAKMAASAFVDGIKLALARPKCDMAWLEQARRRLWSRQLGFGISRDRNAVLAVTRASLEIIGRGFVRRVILRNRYDTRI